MKLKNEHKFMMDTRLLKIIGFYQLFNPRSPKLFGYNIFKCIAAIQIFIFTMTLFGLIVSIYCCLSDIIEGMRCFWLCVIGMVTIYKHSYIIYYSDIIWKCIQLTFAEGLSYKYYSRRIHENGRKKLELVLEFFIVLWFVNVLFWILTPFAVKNSYTIVKGRNEIYHYHLNIINVIYPVTDKFYNDNFTMFYTMECTIMFVWAHVTLIFDVFIIVICIATAYQLKAIEYSFNTLGNVKNQCMSNRMSIVRHDESKVLDVKILIKDQQKVVENMKYMHKIIQPVLFYQIASVSSLITLLSILQIMSNCFNGFSLLSPMNFKLFISISSEIFHTCFIYYLFSNVNEQFKRTAFTAISWCCQNDVSKPKNINGVTNLEN
ncbi:uncharacterized protein LOC100569439 [Acyrthosiphon pisum]|uniref:Odorant receptor n=1 Tax=Acyrthosiphon pisum TaxID=7029 RepID=A0A8R1W4K1_ACYPI|nr:uncharacterized protein LOC100569439 [Acyrthosiphon pisum]|eukprot:XP_003241633.3 PREDICTED: uncharacterized protein LOC100569439 [Acyrthosiphon pisum]